MRRFSPINELITQHKPLIAYLTRNLTLFLQFKPRIFFFLFIVVLFLTTSFLDSRHRMTGNTSNELVPDLIQGIKVTLADLGLRDSFVLGGEDIVMYPQVWYFYQQRNFKPAWTSYARLNQNGSVLLDLIERAQEFGLEPGTYHLEAIHEMQRQLSRVTNSTRHRHIRERTEIFLTDAAVKFMVNLHAGYRFFDSTLFGEPWMGVIPDRLLEGIEKEQVAMGILSVQPGFIEYQRLQQATQQFIRQNTLTDESVNLGKPVKDSILYHYRMLALNLDRLRKQNNSGDHLLWVNIPAYRLKVFRENRLLDTYQIIVGDPKTPTPQLTSRVESIVTNPVWHVPRSIIRNELITKIKSDTGYLRRNRFRIVDKHNRIISHDSMALERLSGEDFNYTLRQDASPENSLGKVKFIFSNPYLVYLHDTPAKTLFSKNIRALSHGCIRVKDPEKLADYMVRTIQEDTTDIRRLIEKGVHREIQLRATIPIRISYITCDVDEKGDLCFYKDIYGMDQLELGSLSPFMGID